jgi:magnesium chelatase family protein
MSNLPLVVHERGGILLAKTVGICLQALEGVLIEIEVDVLNRGLPRFDIVGLPDTSLREARERLRVSFENAGLPYPRHHIVANLAPANIKKEGPGLDLPLAVAIMAGQGYLKAKSFEDTVFIGEVGLDGRIREVPGVLPMSISAYKQGIKKAIVPIKNGAEAALVEGLEVYTFQSISDLASYLMGEKEAEPVLPASYSRPVEVLHDFAEVKGQPGAKRALEIAAAGSHNLIMVGSPGSGKTMLAKCIPSILPRMSTKESLEVTQVYSVSGLLQDVKRLMTQRPFRSPHHSISNAGLVGGGRNPRPGEISLAHYGVLFLDELPEFRKDVLELMRQPMEEGQLTISRASGSFSYPSRFMLVAAMNPCPCGYYGDPQRACTCSELSIHKYRNRISGPLLDRIDLHVDVPRLSYQDMVQPSLSEQSNAIRMRVEEARDRQLKRFHNQELINNAAMQSKHIKRFCSLSEDSQTLLNTAFRKQKWSARAYDRILKVARTIADLDSREMIEPSHLAEAIGYRGLDQKYFV